jgi:prepilin-type N-terminal cleavage/methylation domain-containing protein
VVIVFFGVFYMHKHQSGFTLIELIAVIVILGILAATAVPRFVNLQDEATLATTRQIAGAIESASALNSAVDVAIEAGLTTTATDPLTTVDNCSDGGLLLNDAALPTGYAITAAAVADKAAVTCTLTRTGTAITSTFVIIGAAP